MKVILQSPSLRIRGINYLLGKRQIGAEIIGH